MLPGILRNGQVAATAQVYGEVPPKPHRTRSSGPGNASTGPLLPPLSAAGNCSAGGDYTDISGNAG